MKCEEQVRPLRNGRRLLLQGNNNSNKHNNARSMKLNYPTFFLLSMILVIVHFYIMIYHYDLEEEQQQEQPLSWMQQSSTITTMKKNSNMNEEDKEVWVWKNEEEEEIWNISKLDCFLKEKRPRDRTDCRYDDIGDFLESSSSSAIVHKPLSCIPLHRRIPHSKANDFSYILDQRNKTPEDGSMTALMDYNAVLIPLYTNTNHHSPKNNKKHDSEMDEAVLDQLTGRYHPYFSDDDVERVKYIAFTRSSNLHACKPRFKLWFGSLIQNYMGISLLDQNLQRIDSTDISVNVDQWMMGNMTEVFHDFRPILVSTSNSSSRSPKTKKDQFVLLVSGHLGTYVFPMDIRRVPPATYQEEHDLPPWKTTKLNGTVVPPNSYVQYGDGMQVRFMDHPNRFVHQKEYQRGDSLFYSRGLSRGKNFHFFEVTNNNNSTTQLYMELWPHGHNDVQQKDPPWNSHVVVPVNFTQSVFIPEGDLQFLSFREIQHAKGSRPETLLKGEIRSQKGNPYPPRQRTFSFPNVAPKHMRPNKKFRGTSQIIDMILDGHGPVKVGISHSVSEGKIDEITNATYTERSVYLTQFYAFDPQPPFEILAISGHFCLSHMTANDFGFHDQWISQRQNRTAPITVHGQTYRCPQITFPHSMIEMIGHAGQYVIITYGVNDCYSRSIVVSKRKIATLLLGHL